MLPGDCPYRRAGGPAADGGPDSPGSQVACPAARLLRAQRLKPSALQPRADPLSHAPGLSSHSLPRGAPGCCGVAWSGFLTQGVLTQTCPRTRHCPAHAPWRPGRAPMRSPTVSSTSDTVHAEKSLLRLPGGVSPPRTSDLGITSVAFSGRSTFSSPFLLLIQWLVLMLTVWFALEMTLLSRQATQGCSGFCYPPTAGDICPL